MEGLEQGGADQVVFWQELHQANLFVVGKNPPGHRNFEKKRPIRKNTTKRPTPGHSPQVPPGGCFRKLLASAPKNLFLENPRAPAQQWNPKKITAHQGKKLTGPQLVPCPPRAKKKTSTQPEKKNQPAKRRRQGKVIFSKKGGTSPNPITVNGRETGGGREKGYRENHFGSEKTSAPRQLDHRMGTRIGKGGPNHTW